ncbi:MAG: NrfD/PsrC family molybdoenzyme membrane anchor subunit [Acidiferrobacterales bacterium]
MESLFHVAPYSGYVYPNETVIPWSVLIVVYPYLTGLVAGAFTVSSLYHVFGRRAFKPVARFALVTALSFMIFVPAPLLLHLGHPERAFNAMITPHWTSAFAAFGYFAAFYICLLVVETFFAFREDNVARAQSTTGLARFFYHATTLWSDDVSPRAQAFDRKCIFALAVIGIPAAHGLHGYVGFVFGSLKSRVWWESDLMPVIFLFSAVISGVALLIVLYVLVSLVRKTAIDHDCVQGLTRTLWGFLLFGVLLEVVEFANLFYQSKEGIHLIKAFISGPLFYSYIVLQFGIGAALPILILTVMVFTKTRGNAFVVGAFVSALLALLSVYMMRWNVVIGGQEISRTLKGLVVYHPLILGREGLVAAMGVLAAPLVLLWVLTRLFPPWVEPAALGARDGGVDGGEQWGDVEESLALSLSSKQSDW